MQEFSVNHPVDNEKFKSLVTIYDPIHLFKNIRNNWVTEKMQTLDYIDPDSYDFSSAKWSDNFQIYANECDSQLKLTKLDYKTIFPNNFEK